MCPSPLRRAWPLEGHGQGPQGPPLHGRPCSAGSFKIPIGWFVRGLTLPLIHGYIGWLLVWNMAFICFYDFPKIWGYPECLWNISWYTPGWWLGTFFITFHIGSNNPNWRSPSFFRGVSIWRTISGRSGRIHRYFSTFRTLRLVFFPTKLGGSLRLQAVWDDHRQLQEPGQQKWIHHDTPLMDVWLVLWNMAFVVKYFKKWDDRSESHWRTPSFFKMVSAPPTRC